jgi:hypothetical protein
MKLNMLVLLATFLLIAIAAIAIMHPQPSVMVNKPQPKVMADGGGGAPTPPCIPKLNCTTQPLVGINPY